MGDGRGDFQRVWHEYVGSYFSDKSILDVGAGYGYSRARLAVRSNRITLQDIDRSLMEVCDLIANVSDIRGCWDIVTAFDVIEHAVSREQLVSEMIRLSREGCFITTPSKKLYPRPWHLSPEELVGLVPSVAAYFVRHKEGSLDDVLEVSEDRFMNDATAYAYGIYYRKTGG